MSQSQSDSQPKSPVVHCYLVPLPIADLYCRDLLESIKFIRSQWYEYYEWYKNNIDTNFDLDNFSNIANAIGEQVLSQTSRENLSKFSSTMAILGKFASTYKNISQIIFPNGQFSTDTANRISQLLHGDKKTLTIEDKIATNRDLMLSWFTSYQCFADHERAVEMMNECDSKAFKTVTCVSILYKEAVDIYNNGNGITRQVFIPERCQLLVTPETLDLAAKLRQDFRQSCEMAKCVDTLMKSSNLHSAITNTNGLEFFKSGILNGTLTKLLESTHDKAFIDHETQFVGSFFPSLQQSKKQA